MNKGDIVFEFKKTVSDEGFSVLADSKLEKTKTRWRIVQVWTTEWSDWGNANVATTEIHVSLYPAGRTDQ